MLRNVELGAHLEGQFAESTTQCAEAFYFSPPRVVTQSAACFAGAVGDGVQNVLGKIMFGLVQKLERATHMFGLAGSGGQLKTFHERFGFVVVDIAFTHDVASQKNSWMSNSYYNELCQERL